jgi:hypothetical protein
MILIGLYKYEINKCSRPVLVIFYLKWRFKITVERMELFCNVHGRQTQ